jgi:hypothetical protein
VATREDNQGCINLNSNLTLDETFISDIIEMVKDAKVGHASYYDKGNQNGLVKLGWRFNAYILEMTCKCVCNCMLPWIHASLPQCKSHAEMQKLEDTQCYSLQSS